MQDVLPEDIDRIEVISGPGATLWGANAVNGVINIITRKAAETQGGLLDVGSGSQETRLGRALRRQGRRQPGLSRSISAGFAERDTVTAADQGAGDHWQQAAGRLPPRLDPVGRGHGRPCRATPTRARRPSAGRAGRGHRRPQPDRPLDPHRSGGSAACRSRPITTTPSAARWRRRQVLRSTPMTSTSSTASPWAAQRCGVGRRRALQPLPDRRHADPASSRRRAGTLNLGDLFVQDTVALTDKARVTLGAEAGGRSLFGPGGAAEPAGLLHPEPRDAAVGRGLARRPLAHALRPRRGGEGRRRAVPDRRQRLRAGEADRLRGRRARRSWARGPACRPRPTTTSTTTSARSS